MKRHASLNRLYRLVWSELLNTWVAVAETARDRGKAASRKRLQRKAAISTTTLASLLLTLVLSPVIAAPVGGEVVSGNASISQTGNTTNIVQSTTNASFNWQGFNIAPTEVVNFIQPSASAIAVNRIMDSNGTQILGQLNANGQVYLINPNGILFGAGAQVNVGGLVASSLDFNDASSNNNSRSFSGNGIGHIINQGHLQAADGGYIALLGNSVSNQGVITAQLGTVVLGGGSATRLTFSGNQLLHLQVEQSTLNNLAENRQLIQADGGRVFMSAGASNSLLASVVNNSGIVQAQTVVERDGQIILLGGMSAGTTNVAGTLDASAPHGGNGGFIETSAAQVNIANNARVTTAAATGLTGSWLIDPVDFTVAATGGNITGSALSGLLNSNSVTIQTATGTDTTTNRYGNTGTNGDIFVNDAISWSAAQTLTLNANRNIYINRSITASNAAGKLALLYGQSAVTATNTATYSVNAPVNLQTGQNFSTKLGTTALATKTYQVINSLGAEADATSGAATLQGMAATANLANNYALGSNIDATATASWNAGAGFTPIGNNTTKFSGSFDGLGHGISNLNINRSASNYIGLFGATDSAASISNVGLVASNIKGLSEVGSLVGSNMGKVSNTFTTAVSVIGGGNDTGGLIGQNIGLVSNSYVSGNVSGMIYIGGIAGVNYSTIRNSYSSAYVSGMIYPGSLTGVNFGQLIASFWNKDILATGVGVFSNAGTTGLTSAQMLQLDSFSSWGSTINNTGASGAVWRIYEGHTAPLLTSFMANLTLLDAPNTNVTYNAVSQSAATTVTGGVLGTAATGTNAGFYNSYYSTQLGYNLIGGNLIIAPKALTASVSAPNKIYDGTASASPTLSILSGFVNTETVTATGLATFNTKDVATANLVTINSTLLANGTNGGLASNYSLASGQSIAANITTKALSITGISASSKVYDGTSNATPTFNALSGFVNTETVTASGLASFNNKDVLSANLVTVNSTTLTNGLNGGLASNYSLASGQTATANITALDLNITGIRASNKIYDASTLATLTGTATISALGGDILTIGGTGSGLFNDANVGSGKAVTVSGYSLNGTNAANYNLLQPIGVTANISAADLTISGISTSNKVYNANTAASLSGTATVTALGGDSLTVGGTGSGLFNDANAGNGKAVTVSGYTLSGTAATNYNLLQLTGLTASITPKALTANVSAPNKIYDGTTSANPTLSILSGLVNTETVTANGIASFNSKDVLSAHLVTVNSTSLADGLNGGLASNYSLTSGQTVAASIAAKTIGVNGITANNKVYNASTLVSLNGTPTVNALGSDELKLSGSGSGMFNDANVGSGKAVTVSGYSLGGAAARNYHLLQPMGLTANISIPSEVANNRLSKTIIRIDPLMLSSRMTVIRDVNEQTTNTHEAPIKTLSLSAIERLQQSAVSTGMDSTLKITDRDMTSAQQHD